MEEFNLKSIGKLKPHPDIPDEWLISEPILIPFFGGEQLNFIFNGYEGDETFFSDADEAVSNFLAKDKNYRLEISPSIFENYMEFVDDVGEDEDIPNIGSYEDIWQYIYPQEIYVIRQHIGEKDIYVQIHCECEWEVEHGLQLVFRKGKSLTRVSEIDGHIE